MSKKVRLKEMIKELHLKDTDEILIKVLNKHGAPRRKMMVSDLDDSDLKREVIKIQLHRGGIEMEYNGILFLLK